MPYAGQALCHWITSTTETEPPHTKREENVGGNYFSQCLSRPQAQFRNSRAKKGLMAGRIEAWSLGGP
jgi:hypothetical protein